MALPRFSRLVDDFVGTLERLSATVIRQHQRDDVRPARLRVVTGTGNTPCILFLWNITPGGGGASVRPANERRIQMTGVDSIPLVSGSRTLLGGWSEEFGVYCFWDARRHIQFSSKSPSIQVTSETLETAHRLGIATYLRPAEQGLEVVVAVHPDSLLWYVEYGLPLHNSDIDAPGVQELVEATPEEAQEYLAESHDEPQRLRRYDQIELMRAYRDARFRPAVLRAYRYKCAVCNCALKLVDAAHIVPVSYPQSTDNIDNGLALCSLHHRAYDTGLLGIRSDYRIVTNTEHENKLATLRLDMGLEQFRAALPDTITPPPEADLRPDPAKLIIGLRARSWPDILVA